MHQGRFDLPAPAAAGVLGFEGEAGDEVLLLLFLLFFFLVGVVLAEEFFAGEVRTQSDRQTKASKQQ